MKLIDNLFTVLEHSVSDAGFITTIELNPRHVVYAGHFPGHPVTPGVVLLQIVHELSEKHFGKELKLVTISRCKFLKIVNPDETPQLAVEVLFNRSDELLHVKARGKINTVILFKLEAVYRCIE